MLSSFDSNAQAAAASAARGFCWLVEWDFSSGLIRTATYPTDVTALDATVWTRVGGNLAISPPKESDDLNTAQIEFKVAVTDAAWFAYAIGNPTVYRDRPVRCYLQMMDTEGRPVGARSMRIAAFMNKIAIEREQPTLDNGGVEGYIVVSATRSGLARSRRKDGLRLTDAQQQARYPGDLGYQYVSKLIEQPTTWLSKRFQELR